MLELLRVDAARTVFEQYRQHKELIRVVTDLSLLSQQLAHRRQNRKSQSAHLGQRVCASSLAKGTQRLTQRLIRGNPLQGNHYKS